MRVIAIIDITDEEEINGNAPGAFDDPDDEDPQHDPVESLEEILNNESWKGYLVQDIRKIEHVDENYINQFRK